MAFVGIYSGGTHVLTRCVVDVPKDFGTGNGTLSSPGAEVSMVVLPEYQSSQVWHPGTPEYIARARLLFGVLFPVPTDHVLLVFSFFFVANAAVCLTR